MSENKSTEINDEIDLREFFLAMWRGKYVVFLVTVLSFVCASFYLRGSERLYSVKMVLKPVVAEASGPNLSGFSGLASFAGVSLPSSSGSDFTTYQKLIFSEEVSERIFTNKELVVKLFGGEWNSDSQSFEAPLSGNIGKLKQQVRLFLTGAGKGNYIPPNPKRLSMMMAGIYNISEEKSTGFVSISAETSKPNLIVDLISTTTQETDNLLKERFFASSEDTLAFYYQKLLTSRS